MAATVPAPYLLSAVTLGGIVLKNRVALAPLTRCRCPGAKPNEVVKTYYEQRAAAGILITEATHVSPMSMVFANSPGIWTDDQAAAWREITDAVHKKDSVIFCQLQHSGRAAHSSFLPGSVRPISASEIAINDGVYTASGAKVPLEVPRAMTLDDIKTTVAEFKNAAKQAKQAGFDGVELHSANGYLIDQFLQSCSNRRTDSYGGSVENRFRFFREVLEAVLGELPSSRVAARLSPNSPYNGQGSEDNIETYTYAVSELNKYGLGYLHFLDGLGFGFHQKTRPMTLTDARKVYDGLIMANVGYSRDVAEGVIRSGAADLVAFGRPYMSNPDLVERFSKDLPLAPDPDMKTWYGVPGADLKTGYIDFPAFSQK